MPDDFPKQTMSKQCQLISAGQNELHTFYLVFGSYLHGGSGQKAEYLYCGLCHLLWLMVCLGVGPDTSSLLS